MTRDQAILDALSYWGRFTSALARVWPGVAFDLEGDPPQFIRELRHEASLASDVRRQPVPHG